MKKRQRNDEIENIDDKDLTTTTTTTTTTTDDDDDDDDDDVTHTQHNNNNNDNDDNDDTNNIDDDDSNNEYDDDDMVAEYKNSIKDDDNDDDDDVEDENEGDAHGEETENDDSSKAIQENKEQQMTSKAASKKQKLSIQKAMEYNEQMSQRGIIYVARIPPHMTPMKMKHLLSMYGTKVTRIFCQLDTNSHNKPKKGPKRYVEGWVEFDNKKMAKQIAASLHQQRISNIKRNIHYDDYWCMKYLGSQFTWSILTEKVAYEKRIREQKLRMETIHDRKQIQHYQQAYMTNQHIQQRRIESNGKKEGKMNQKITTLNDE